MNATHFLGKMFTRRVKVGRTVKNTFFDIGFYPNLYLKDYNNNNKTVFLLTLTSFFLTSMATHLHTAENYCK